MKTNTTKQRGFTFIEIAIVIAIIAAAAAILISNGTSIKSGNNVKDASREIATVASAVSGTYQFQRGDYSGVTPAQIAGTNKVPATMVSGTTLINVFGSVLTIIPVALAGSAPGKKNGFTIGYPTPDKKTCSDIASTNIGKYVSIKAGSTNITSVATAQTACAGNQILSFTSK